MIEKQELYCHECNSYVQFELDLELEGNHVLKCPKCGHEHCRVVTGGRITGDRWDSRNRNSYTVTYNVTWSATSTWNNYYNISYNGTGNTASYNTYTYTTNSTNDDDTAKAFLYRAWMNYGA